MLIPARGIVQASGGGGPTTVLEDAFTSGSGSTELDAWTPTAAGDGYTDDTTNSTAATDLAVVSPYMTIDSNDPEDRQRYYTDPSPSSADQRVTVTVRDWYFPAEEEPIQYTLRATSGGGGYVLNLHKISFDETVTLEYHSNATSKTELGSYEVTGADDGDEIVFEIVGTSLSVSVNGTERITATDSNISAAGEMAVGAGFGATDRGLSTLCTRIDDHKFEDL